MSPPSSELAQAFQLQQSGRYSEAEGICRALLVREPDRADAWRRLAGALLGQGRVDEAIACYRHCLRLHPEDPEAHNNIGALLARKDDADGAIDALRAALRLRPEYADALSNLGNLLRERGELAEAERCLRQAVTLRPDFAQAQTNLGVVYLELGRLDAAADCHREAIRAKPDLPDALANLASVLLEQARPDEAAYCAERALTIDPQHILAHTNRGLALLTEGDYPAGWPDYEWRWQTKDHRPRSFAQPQWDGASFVGRTLLVHHEQGLGDTLQFLRFLPEVQRRGGRVVFECQAALAALLAGVPGADAVVPADAPLPAFDVYAPLLSLPGILGTTLDGVPAEVPYLRADAKLVEYWRRQLAPMRGFKVGVAWQGNPRNLKDKRRSVPLHHFGKLARAPGVRLISLQKNARPEARKPAAGEAVPIVDFGPQVDVATGAFMDTAALIANLDLVITVDTAVAHLAGALGAPVWLLLCHAPDWRWLLRRSDSPWYPTLRLFRERVRDDWEGVFTRVAAALAPLAAGAPPVHMIDTTPGELLDRLAYLEVEGRPPNPDPAGLRQIHAERQALAEVRAVQLPASAELDALTAELRQVHAELWTLADRLRTHERRGEFGATFAQLAGELVRADERRETLQRTIDAACR